MEITRAERDEKAFDLIKSLLFSTHLESILIWVYEYLQLIYYSTKDGKSICTGKVKCIKAAPEEFADLITCLSEFRNAYVHRGAFSAAKYLVALKAFDSANITLLFNETCIPVNARNVFWNWYNS